MNINRYECVCVGVERRVVYISSNMLEIFYDINILNVIIILGDR